MKNVLFKYLPALFFASILAPTLWAQQPVRSCATVEYNRQKEQNNPSIAAVRQHANQLIEQYKNGHPAYSSRGGITIPVVVHVIYSNNLQNISDAQIYSQIDVLNKDYARLNDDAALTPAAFSSVAANTGIQFCLATQDPNGNPTTGIERRLNTGTTAWSNNDEMKSYNTGGLDAWPRSFYLNIWVCNLANNYLGYTQLPGSPDSLNDGCVITSRAFGDTGYVSPPFHLGRTTTHEVGHWLGLNHVWGDDGGVCPWDLGGNDDQISDTPPQGTQTIGCPSFPLYDNCSTAFPGIMFMNYMDYTDDACMNIFTQGQANQMNLVLITLRPFILTSDGCGLIGINEASGFENEITVYPNPASIELKIKIAALKIEKLEIYDFLGRHLFSQKPKAESQELIIDVSSLDRGTYFLKITSLYSVRAARFTVAR